MAATTNLAASSRLSVAIFIAAAVVVRGQWLDYDISDYDDDYDYGEGELLNYDIDAEVGGEKREEKPCEPPPSLRNGQTRVWGGGLLLEYSCNTSSFPVGATHGACDLSTGHWTIDPPLCVETKCPSLVAPNRGVVNIDTSGGVANFACRSGYYLIGSRVLLCEGGAWQGVYPLCVVKPKLKTTTAANSNVTTTTTPAPITEDLSVIDSDESCFHNHVEPPVLASAVVAISYVMNELRGRYVMLATYTCFAGYRLANDSADKLFCRNMQWGAAITPKCISKNDPCALNNGGCEQVCLPGDDTFQCTCSDGFTLKEDAKSCQDMDECVIDNGGCQQECHNTHASFFCSCYHGYAAKGPQCIESRRTSTTAM